MELISKEEVIYAIINTPSNPDFDVMPNGTTFRTGSAFRQHEIIDIINNLPTVESRPKGKWIDGLNDRGFYNECSFCGHCHYESYYHSAHPNYCPNCGTEMESE